MFKHILRFVGMVSVCIMFAGFNAYGASTDVCGTGTATGGASGAKYYASEDGLCHNCPASYASDPSYYALKLCGYDSSQLGDIYARFDCYPSYNSKSWERWYDTQSQKYRCRVASYCTGSSVYQTIRGIMWGTHPDAEPNCITCPSITGGVKACGNGVITCNDGYFRQGNSTSSTNVWFSCEACPNPSGDYWDGLAEGTLGGVQDMSNASWTDVAGNPQCHKQTQTYNWATDQGTCPTAAGATADEAVCDFYQVYKPNCVTADGAKNGTSNCSWSMVSQTVTKAGCGSYRANNNTECALCPIGYYGGKASTRTSCSKCAAGKYADQLGTIVCKTCPAGTYSKTDRSGCEQCASGKWSSAGAGSCSNPPANATVNSTQTGWYCNAGYYKDGSECIRCPSYEPQANGTSSAGATSVTECFLPTSYSFSNGTGTYSPSASCYHNGTIKRHFCLSGPSSCTDVQGGIGYTCEQGYGLSSGSQDYTNCYNHYLYECDCNNVGNVGDYCVVDMGAPFPSACVYIEWF